MTQRLEHVKRNLLQEEGGGGFLRIHRYYRETQGGSGALPASLPVRASLTNLWYTRTDSFVKLLNLVALPQKRGGLAKPIPKDRDTPHLLPQVILRGLLRSSYLLQINPFFPPLPPTPPHPPNPH